MAEDKKLEDYVKRNRNRRHRIRRSGSYELRQKTKKPKPPNNYWRRYKENIL